jgi:hypothetical protein
VERELLLLKSVNKRKLEIRREVGLDFGDF